jgi:hypothetical protein
MKIYLYLLLISLLDMVLLNSVLHSTIVIALMAIAIFKFIRNLGVRICIMELIAIIGCLIYLVAPLISYHFYNENSYLATLYQTTMPIEEKQYFNFALPGTLLLLIGLSSTPVRQIKTDYELIQNVKEYLSDRRILGVLLILLGLASSAVLRMIPYSFWAIVYYSSQLTFIGIFYLLHSNIKGKKWITFAAFALLIAQSSITAMYGELVFWSAFGVMILTIGTRVKLIFKMSMVVIAAGFVLLLQSVKQEYRMAMWTGSDQGSKPSVMFEIAKSKLLDPSAIFKSNKLFAMATRMNQGFLVARTMAYVPRKEPFANGETIVTSLAAALVPRFVWNDKPEVGGRDMVCRFLGDCHKLKYAYDIGQLGEGYVNFGVIGGAIFMFFYGWFIRFAYTILANLSIRHATLILWIPLIFFSALSLETDFLTFINSFTKAIVFCLVIYGGAKFTWNSIR